MAPHPGPRERGRQPEEGAQHGGGALQETQTVESWHLKSEQRKAGGGVGGSGD